MTTLKTLLAILPIIYTSSAIAGSNAYGLTDGTQLNPTFINLSKASFLPYGLTQSQLDTLANHTLWQRLLLMKNGKSQIQQTEFFLAADGNTHAKNELIATLMAMEQKDHTAICRFPARIHFLNTQLTKLNIQSQVGDDVCDEFNTWFNALDGQALSLIFADEHPNVLASAFSHVFLRLDTKKSLISQQDSDAIAINYSSITHQKPTSAALIAVKSTFGGFDGGIEFLNFAQKQADYLVKDERDIWQYLLDLTPEQTKQILRHLWETKDVSRPYFFTHNNCATEIVRLIDVVRPDKNIAKAVGKIVIPSKIARILNEQGMIKSTQFIASSASKRQAQFNAPEFDVATISSNNNPIYASATHRLGLSAGLDSRHDKKMVYDVSIRSAYHDVLDNPMGVRKFLDVKLLSLDMRYDDEKLKIQDATIFATRSYNPINSAKNNPDKNGKAQNAWGFALGLTQAIDASDQANADHLVFNFRQEKGRSWVFGAAKTNVGDLPDTLCYTLGSWGGQLGRINQGYRVGAGVHMGCIHYALDNLRLMGELHLPLWYHHDTSGNRSSYIQPSANVAMQYDLNDLNKKHAIRLLGEVQKNHQNTHHQIQLQYLKYF